MSNYTFGNYLCSLREKRGLSQSQLGERLGVSNKAVSKWENGGAYPSSELMLPLAKELGISIEELYAAVSNSKTQKTKKRRLLDALSKRSTVILLCVGLPALVSWGSFLAFGSRPDKAMMLILMPVMTAMYYGFVRLLFFIFQKNPMTSSNRLDRLSLYMLFGPVLAVLLTTVVEFVTAFPNGYSPSFGAAIGIMAGVLHAYKKRI